MISKHNNVRIQNLKHLLIPRPLQKPAQKYPGQFRDHPGATLGPTQDHLGNVLETSQGATNSRTIPCTQKNFMINVTIEMTEDGLMRYGDVMTYD